MRVFSRVLMGGGGCSSLGAGETCIYSRVLVKSKNTKTMENLGLAATIEVHFSLVYACFY
jgi:hypothetical protein